LKKNKDSNKIIVSSLSGDIQLIEMGNKGKKEDIILYWKLKLDSPIIQVFPPIKKMTTSISNNNDIDNIDDDRNNNYLSSNYHNGEDEREILLTDDLKLLYFEQVYKKQYLIFSFTIASYNQVFQKL
jgi:hypothetical protein